MRLIKYLNEFVKTNDSDWPIKSKYLIIFDKNDKYQLQGKTHSKGSHAISI